MSLLGWLKKSLLYVTIATVTFKSTMQTRTALHILRELFLVVFKGFGKPVYLDDYGHSQIGS
jgi:hypothetical protein